MGSAPAAGFGPPLFLKAASLYPAGQRFGAGPFCFFRGTFPRAPPSPAFEVASIRPSDTGAPEQFSLGIHIDGAQINCNYLSLRGYIRIAWRLKDYQISGPDWLRSARFDIAAKLPEGASRDEVPAMIRLLLEDRFGLKTHLDRKDFPVYRLVRAKGPLKLKESPLDPVAPDSPDGTTGSPLSRSPLSGTNVTAVGGRGGATIDLGRGASFAVSHTGIEARKLSMTVFADSLGRFTDRPIVDATGLAGTWDISIPLEPEDFRALMVRSALNAGVDLPPQAVRALDAGAEASFFPALESLGLKLEPARDLLDVLIVDHIGRTPSDN